MNGGRVTNEEKETLSTYIGVGILTVLAVGAIYFYFQAQEKIKEVQGFDPNRPVPSDATLRKRLKREQYFVVRENGNQTPFQNEFWNNYHPGIYLDVITGEPLFTSLDKYDAGIGQPSFTKPISKDLLVEKLDTSYNMQRTELRAKRSDAHLGYLLPDPTTPTVQLHAIASAALRFVPMERMKEEGYESFRIYMEKK
jgi:methionine-R-sulfoxide reductase